jgi:GLPGLI family protein
MQKLLLTMAMFCVACTIWSQSSETLKVKYSETIFFEMKGDMPPQLAANMPKSRKLNKILYATAQSSLYIVNKEDKVEENEDTGRSRWAMKRGGVDPIVYCNYDDLKTITGTDLFGKEFIIEEEKEYTWKIHTGEQREILGYTCIKATYQKDSILTTAWYTPKIQMSVGPDGYNGLPGLILAVSEGERKVLLATLVEEKFLGSPAIVAPSKGEKVSREKFDKIRNDKMKEMKEMYGRGNGSGPIMIRG